MTQLWHFYGHLLADIQAAFCLWLVMECAWRKWVWK